ncbi:MAG: type II secretion system minor pseudopilin GspI [Gammaproteobacteria bacterium]|nr:type II secretion system minor pseudopilin GspI [Gammaproteobacteria bacterium]NNC97373.1 type II secretion system minor pseudopilin GspI [Gammaproteobacteria bacterium]NNM13108.1 type II secretion system minor pseudopilin GspI [Gammaproteobacteria bacterium]
MKFDRSKGFTLIEVVVATFIVGLALVALAGTVQNLTRQTSLVKEKYVADLVANNVLAELRLAGQWPEIGENSDVVEMASQSWFYDTKVFATDVEQLRRIEVSVGLDDELKQTRATLIGFISSSPTVTAQPVEWVKSQEQDNQARFPDDLNPLQNSGN